MPGSGTAVPPDDELVLPLDVPPDVVPPDVVPPDVLLLPDLLPPEELPPPQELDVDDEVEELDEDELDPCEPPELLHPPKWAWAGLAASRPTRTVATVAKRFIAVFMAFFLQGWPRCGRMIVWLTQDDARAVPSEENRL